MVEKTWKKTKGDLALHVPTGVYYVRKSFVRLKIPNLFKTTGQTQLWKAKAEAPSIIKKHLDLHLRKVKTVSEVIEEFLRVETSNPQKRRLSTQGNHRIYFKQLAEEWGSQAIGDLDEVVWLDWLSKFRQRKKRKTYNDYAVYMNMLLNYAARRRYITHRAKMPFTDAPRETGRVLSKADINRLFEAMNEDTKDWFVLAYNCAMRLREALHLTWDRVDLKDGIIRLGKENVKTGSKTGKGRSFIVPADVLERLRARRARAKSPHSAFVFPAKGLPNQPQNENNKAWRDAKKRAGISGKLRRHDIRHTAITHLIFIEKIDIAVVSEYVGTSVRTLQRVYLHSTPEDTKAAAVLKIGAEKFENSVKK